MTWVTSVPILVFLGLFVLELGPMYATDVRRQTDVRQQHRLMPPPYGDGGIIEDCVWKTLEVHGVVMIS